MDTVYRALFRSMVSDGTYAETVIAPNVKTAWIVAKEKKRNNIDVLLNVYPTNYTYKLITMDEPTEE